MLFVILANLVVLTMPNNNSEVTKAIALTKQTELIAPDNSAESLLIPSYLC